MAYANLGDKASAFSELGLYLAANPNKRAGLAQDRGWQFASIANDPTFQHLIGSAR